MLKIVVFFERLYDVNEFFFVKPKCYALLTFCTLSIRFWYFDNSDDLTINRCIHARTLEGDGEKPSRHENEGPLLVLSFLFVYDEPKWKAKIEDCQSHSILKQHEPSEFAKVRKCLCLKIDNAYQLVALLIWNVHNSN